jgi:NadR type nicotinamide-nucleotide adenylyltransferase
LATDRPRRIVLTGSESTGKSELATALAAHFGAPVTREFARDYALANEAPLDASDVEAIARGQMALEDAAEGPLVICDTDLVSTVVYSNHYYSACAPPIVDAARTRLADLYLLLDIDVPWTPDPARDAFDQREAIHARFVATLEALGANYVVIRGNWEERRDAAIAAIEAHAAR